MDEIHFKSFKIVIQILKVHTKQHYIAYKVILKQIMTVLFREYFE
jgi:hypothetical protein